jgi:TfoX/Sxy family transcriptional regulator of competence genes
MKFEKSSPEVVALFERVFPDDPRAERRQMFGYPAGFVNGNMFGGLFANDVMLRLSDADRQVFQEQHGAQPFSPMGRPMKEYVGVPHAIVSDPDQLSAWVRRAFDYASSLPPKAPKPAKAAKPRRR